MKNFKKLIVEPNLKELNKAIEQDIKNHKPSRDSMTYWFPKIKKLDILIPKTIMIPVDYGEAYKSMDTPGAVPSYKSLVSACEKMGYPLFLRTDHTSFKQDWQHSCYIKSQKNLKKNANWLKYNTFVVGIDSIDAFYVRKLIPLKTSFYAFDGKMPITKEVRCFINEGEKVCQHPYWKDEVFEEEEKRVKEHNDYFDSMPYSIICSTKKETGLPVDWRVKLAKLNRLTKKDQVEIDRLCGIVADEFDEYWSVDFAQHKNGKVVSIRYGDW